MRSAYDAADVVLNASFSEGLSNILLEAVTAGRPVLASDIQNNRWPVVGEDGARPAGYLFDLTDLEDFVEKALRLIDDEALRKSLGEAGKERAKNWPSPAAEAEGLLKVYEAALKYSSLYQSRAVNLG